MSGSRPKRNGQRRHLAVGALAAAASLWLLSAGTQAAWTSGVVTDQTNTAATAKLGVKHTYGASTCVNSVNGNVDCPNPLIAGNVPTSGALSAVDTITNQGTGSSAGMTSSLKVTGCDPARLENVERSDHSMLIRGDTSMLETDKWGTGGGGAIKLGGDPSDYAADATATPQGDLDPTFTFGVWFRTPSSNYNRGGVLIALAESAITDLSTGGGTLIWLDNSGRVNTSIESYGSSRKVITSSATGYNNGGWHLAVVSLSSDKLTLYMDGAKKGSASGLSPYADLTNYWHLGWGDFGTGSGRVTTNLPAQSNFPGYLMGAFTMPGTTLSSSNVSSLYTANAASVYQSRLQAFPDLKNLWMLNDTGMVPYTGQPTGLSGDVCAGTSMSVNPDTSGGASAAKALSSLPTFPLPVPNSGASKTETLSLTRNGSFNDFTSGLHLLVPMTYSYGFATPSTWKLSLGFAPAASSTIIP